MSRLTSDIADLVKKEAALAKLEAEARLEKLTKDIAAGMIGGAFLYVGLLVLAGSAVLGLSHLVDPWLAALLVGVGFSLIGVAIAGIGAGDAKKQADGLEAIPRRVRDAQDPTNKRIRQSMDQAQPKKEAA
jgi:hypothetical protein